MESIMSHTGEQFRNNAEDGCTAQPRVMSTREKAKEAEEAKKMRLDKIRERRTRLLERETRLLEQLNEPSEQNDYVTFEDFRMIQLIHFPEWKKREEREVQSAAEQIKDETQELQQNTDSHSDPQIRQTAEFVQKMSEEILEQKERISDIKATVKETCREVKIFLQQITNLAGDKLQSLNEEAKLKLDSLIKKFWKMTASMWKLIFCVLLLYELRDMFDSLKSESYNISLNRGRLKYAFKMASMLAIWLSHDVETNPGPQFNDRTCIEMLVRRLSESLRGSLNIGGSIWSKEVANAAYSAGFSRMCKWNNPSGKGKDSFLELIDRAMELGRVLSVRNCLLTDLATFTVNLDQQETRDRLKQYLMLENLKTAVDALLYEDLTTQTAGTIRHLIQILQEKMSYSGRMIYGPEARTPTATIVNPEFSKLTDPQCTHSTVSDSTIGISDIVTQYCKRRRQGKKNKKPRAKQFIEVVASEPHTADGLTCDAMFSGGMMVEAAEIGDSSKELASSSNTLQQDEDFRSSTNSLPTQTPSTVTFQKVVVDHRGLTNSLCTLSTSTATFQQDDDCRGSTSSLPLQSTNIMTHQKDDDDLRGLTDNLCSQSTSTATSRLDEDCSSSDNSLCTQSKGTGILHADEDRLEARMIEENSEFVRMTLDEIREMEMEATPSSQGIDSSHTSVIEHDTTSDDNTRDESGNHYVSKGSSREEKRNAGLVPSSDSSSFQVTGVAEGLLKFILELTPEELESGLFDSMQGGDTPSRNILNADYPFDAKTQDVLIAGDATCEDDTTTTPSDTLNLLKEREVVTRTTKRLHDTTPLMDTGTTEKDKQTCEERTERDIRACETSEIHTHEDRISTEANEYITKSEFQAVSSRLEIMERTVEELKSQTGLGQVSTPQRDRSQRQEPNDKPGTTPEYSSERRLTGNTRRKRKLQHQHLPTKKRRQ